MASLSVDFAGLKLANPLIASAGPVTAEVENVKRLADAGIGAVVTKTGFTEEEYCRWVGRRGIFPYKPVYKYQGLEGGTLLSLPSLSDVPVRQMAERVHRMKELGIPVIASVMGLSVRGYSESAALMEAAGADAIELDLCCIIPEFVTKYKFAGQLANERPSIYARIMKAVKSAVSIPVGAKTTYSITVAAKLLEGVLRAKIKGAEPDFLTLVGQAVKNPGIDLETLQPLFPFPSLGWQGELKEVTYFALSTLGTTFARGKPYLSASGGLANGGDVATAMALGASTVQFQAALLDQGPALIPRLLAELEEFLAAHSLESAEQLVGYSLPGYIPALAMGSYMRARDALFGEVVASVDEKLCSACGLCEELCTESAIEVTGGAAAVTRDRCRGCNLCVLKCPEGALSLENLDKLDDLIDTFVGADVAAPLKSFMSKKRTGLLDALALLQNMKAAGLK